MICLAFTTGFHHKLQSLRPLSTNRLSMQSKFMETMPNDDVIVPPLATEPPLKVLLMVEPTPFNYVSGYANRFKEMLKFLRQAGDDVRVLTADKDPNPPTEFLGYPITTNRGFEFILYKHVTLTFDFNMATKKMIEEFQPDVIHVASPSCLIYAGIHSSPSLPPLETTI